MNQSTNKKFNPFTFDRYPTKVKCTFRQNELALSDFTTSAGDYTYAGSYEENGLSINYQIRVNGKYPNRMFNAKYPPEISVNGNADLMGIRLAVLLPMKTIKTDVVEGTRKEELSYSDKDISISATFEIPNEQIIKASRQKMKKH